MYEKLIGTVIKWKQLGKKIWFPTANISVTNTCLSDGTYKINVRILGKKYRWVWVYFWKENLFEAHIFDFDNDIYSQEIEIFVLYKIRENKKFDSLEELKKQISKDVDFCKNTFDNVLTFWTFDIFHEWHKNFFLQANNYGDWVITVVATDENVMKFKWNFPQNNEEERLKKVIESGLIHTWIIGKWTNPMAWIDIYKPKVICLWYDQKWFCETLEKYIQTNKLNISILRLKPYQENIYKSSLLKLCQTPITSKIS